MKANKTYSCCTFIINFREVRVALESTNGRPTPVLTAVGYLSLLFIT